MVGRLDSWVVAGGGEWLGGAVVAVGTVGELGATAGDWAGGMGCVVLSARAQLAITSTRTQAILAVDGAILRSWLGSSPG